MIRDEKIKRARRGGFSSYEIGKQLGLPASTVRYVIRTKFPELNTAEFKRALLSRTVAKAWKAGSYKPKPLKLKSKAAVRRAWDGKMTITELSAKLSLSNSYFLTWLKREMPAFHKRIRAVSFNYGNRGKTAPNYKGRCVTKNGYIRVSVNGSRRLEHRVIAEQLLGRKLKKGEVVHHLDGDRQNNVSSNLIVLGCDSKHRTLHETFQLLLSKKHPKVFKLLIQEVLDNLGGHVRWQPYKE